MRTLNILVGVFLLSAASLRGQNTCAPADVNSEHMIGAVKNLMTTDQASARETLGVPLVALSEIVLVSDPAVCARAGEAADSIVRVWKPGATHPPTTAPLYVVRIGTSFAVADLNGPPNPDDEFASVLIFGPLWQFKSLVGM